ncbi:hypothetical protein SAMN05216349_1316 [Oribacterium sp. KHPX15]|uniref:hypothetical protein n=1 Tax=Oribacterium sp. KHPX15 TaxID=1855342 RepID=UPI00089C1209|nr:hypothetical protein [Oribacterium sp. KHPX15]SEA81203.1 hypothetical protein SAMN05216349_1316 [Oribacterium sp. KHPX15]
MQCSYEHKDISEGSEILKRRIYINVKTIKNIGAGCFDVFYLNMREKDALVNVLEVIKGNLGIH